MNIPVIIFNFLLGSGLLAGECVSRMLERPLFLTDIFRNRKQRKVTPSFISRPNSVSVIIPARDEERNLPGLLKSLIKLGSTLFEVIVIDDGSQDKTSIIAHSFGAKVILSKPLPVGWTGKTWACFQGAQEAQGETFIFLDADTWFEEDGFSKAWQKFAQVQFSPLSFLPWHRPQSLYEEASLFFNILLGIGVIGPGVLSGQSLWIQRKDYFAIGGHEAIRGEILENLFMSRLLMQQGLKPRCYSGQGILSMRMYPDGLKSLIQGWVKAFARGSQKVPSYKMILSIVWISSLFWPWYAFIYSWIEHGAGIKILSFFYLAYVLQLWLISRVVGKFRLMVLFLYPLPLFVFQGVFLISRRKQQGTRVSWKGRDVRISSAND